MPADVAKARPSRAAQARRRRRLALARELDGTLLGPDRSKVVHEYPDGWTARRVVRLADQRREGLLGRNCLRCAVSPVPGLHSLRDEDNLPHATFVAWRLVGSRVERMLRAETDAGEFDYLLFEEDVIFVFDLLHPGATAHLRRLRTFARAQASALPPLPRARMDAMRAISRIILLTEYEITGKRPGRAYEALLRRMERETGLAETNWGTRLGAAATVAAAHFLMDVDGRSKRF